MSDELKRLHEATNTLRLWQRAMRGVVGHKSKWYRQKGLPLKATDALGLITAIDTVLDTITALKEADSE